MNANNGKPIRVLCADDNADIAGLLRMVIEAEADMTCVAVVQDAAQILAEVARTNPTVIILDLSMPGHDSLKVIGQVAAAAPEARTIIYSGYDDPQTRDEALNAGAWGYVSKHQESSRLLEAIRQVANGQLAMK